MNLGGRLAIGFAVVAAVVCAAIGGLSYLVTDRTLDQQTRQSLVDAAAALAAGQVPEGLSVSPAPDGDGDGDDGVPGTSTDGDHGGPGPGGDHHRRGGQQVLLLGQRLAADGTATGIDDGAVRLPVDAADRVVAGSPTDHDLRFRAVVVDDERYLMLTRSVGRGDGAVQVARSLGDHVAVLTRLAEIIAVVAFLVALAAAVAGLFLARALTRRLVRLTSAVEEVTATGRLDLDVPARGRDEVGHLGAAFNNMLTRLARARDDQQRLVQNAGHELRTPLTSIRTNVSLLRRAAELPPEERTAILDDLTGETKELTDLVNELVELATDRRAGEPEAAVDVRAVAERVAGRAGRRTGRQVEVAPQHGEIVVLGRADALERAIGNLVDNAIKFDTAGSPVRVVITGGPDGVRVEVLDSGPGVPSADLERIFDRFHRVTASRSLPGSGLGLAIVREVATEHDGRVFAHPRDGGGLVVGFTLPAERLQTGSYPG